MILIVIMEFTAFYSRLFLSQTYHDFDSYNGIHSFLFPFVSL